MIRALIIVDYQNDYDPPDGALSVPAGEEIAERIDAHAASGDYERAIEALRAAGATVA
jgi:nicotinamidase-related amidase